MYRRLWRAAGAGIFLVWLFTAVLNLEYLDPDQTVHRIPSSMSLLGFEILSIGTLAGLLGAVVFPLCFWIYAVIACFWGLEHVIDGGDVCGLILYGIGLAFAYKQGLFTRFTKIKVIIAVLLVMGGIGSQYRYGTDHLLKTVLRCVFLALMGGVGILLFLPEIQKMRAHEEEASSEPPERSTILLSAEERAVAECMLKGDKYDRIAIDLNISVPTVKRRAKRLFERLQVTNREEFLDRYGGGLPDSI